MAQTGPTYVLGAELPDLGLELRDGSGNVIDFSTGYTFSLKVGQPGSAAAFSKATGITGASSIPNVTITWSTTGELNSLSAGTYIVDLIARRGSDNKDRIFRFVLPVEAGIT